MNDLEIVKNTEFDNISVFNNLNTRDVIESNIYEKKFAEILISNEQEQFNFLKIYPLFKRKENILFIWKKYYDAACDINKPQILNFIILALKNDLIEYKTKDILNIIDGISDVSNKELIRMSVINGKSKTGINKISLVDDPHISPNDSNVNIKELNFKEFALELTRIFAHLNEKITYHELLFVAQHDNKYHKNENEIITPIEILIDHFHKLNYMVLHSILIEDKNDGIRMQTIKHILKICEELKILNNYHGLFALIAGLNNSSIQKLDILWKNKKYSNTFIEFSDIINPTKNYKNYRDIIKKNTKNNFIPYIGITISDIKHILECPLYDIEKDNFNMDLYNILLTILNNYKNTPLKYNIGKNNLMFKWISNIKIIYSDSYFYELALNLKKNNNNENKNVGKTTSGNLIPNLNIHEQLIHKLNNKQITAKITNDESSNYNEEFSINTNIYEQTHDSVEDVIKLTNFSLGNESTSMRQFSSRETIEEYNNTHSDTMNIPLNHSGNSREISSILPIVKQIDNNINEIKLWSINDVQKWLHTINMQNYCDIFLNEDIDGIALYNLTNDHLKNDLHIKKLGHRLKILDSLRTFINS